MFFLWIVGFLLPWLAGIFLWRWDREAIWLTAPIAILVAFVINELGFALDFWSTSLTVNPETLLGLPLIFGLYPVTASFSTFALRHHVRSWLVALVSGLFLTLAEGVGVSMQYVHYGHGWNIGWTFVSYVLSMLIVIGYIRLVSPKSFHQS